MADKVNYQTLSSRDLARSVMSTGGWSNILVFPSLLHALHCCFFFLMNSSCIFFPESFDPYVSLLLQCEGKESHQPVDIAVVFVGKEVLG